MQRLELKNIYVSDTSAVAGPPSQHRYYLHNFATIVWPFSDHRVQSVYMSCTPASWCVQIRMLFDLQIRGSLTFLHSVSFSQSDTFHLNFRHTSGSLATYAVLRGFFYVHLQHGLDRPEHFLSEHGPSRCTHALTVRRSAQSSEVLRAKELTVARRQPCHIPCRKHRCPIECRSCVPIQTRPPPMGNPLRFSVPKF